MIGDPDPLYVRARKTLLDAVEALSGQRDAFTLVGAQAIYIHTGDAGFAVANFTSDADFAVTPSALTDEPLLDKAMRAAGFHPANQPGAWTSSDNIPVDLMVPETLADKGRRSAELGIHGARTARWAAGLEGAVVDRARHVIPALDPSDARSLDLWVAGPAALLVAKLFKIAERVDQPTRLNDKDALDVFRLLQSVETRTLLEGWQRMADDPISRSVLDRALVDLRRLFGPIGGPGVKMAQRATDGLVDPDWISASIVFLTDDLLVAIEAGR